MERGQKKQSQLDSKAPIADPEPELPNEGDAALDLHSISSAENQVRVRKKDRINLCEITGRSMTDHLRFVLHLLDVIMSLLTVNSVFQAALVSEILRGFKRGVTLILL